MAARKSATKNPLPPKHLVTDEKGDSYVLHGFGWGKDHPLDIDPRIDLTKPIWEQVQRLAKLDKRQAQKPVVAA